MKLCNFCHKVKPVDSFGKNGIKNGKQMRNPRCSECNRPLHQLRQKRYVNKLRLLGLPIPAVNSDRRKEQRKEYLKNNPWIRHYNGARTRTSFPYSLYFKRGLKFEMTIQDFKNLWFRDKAYEMNKPSIDRKYSNVGYVLSNCRFIELHKNLTRKRIFSSESQGRRGLGFQESGEEQ